MKVYNLTDVPTPALKHKGLVEVPIMIGKMVVKPGTMEAVPDRYRAQTQKYVLVGAMSVDHLPKTYRGKTYVPPEPTEEKKKASTATMEEAPSPSDPPVAAENEIPPSPDTESSPEADSSEELTGGSRSRRSRRRK